MAKKKIIFISVGAIVLIAACIVAVVFFNSRNASINDDLTFNLGGDIGSQNLKAASLEFVIWGPSQEWKELNDQKEIFEQIEKKARKQLNVKLNFYLFPANPDSYITTLKSYLAGGEPCDAFSFSDEYPEGLKTLADEKVIMDITKLFPQYAPSYYGKFSKEELSIASVDGKIYAIPSRMPSTNMRCAIVREDLMKKYNIPDIKSYDDYEVFLKAVKHNEKDIVPMVHNDTTIGLFAEAYDYVILDYQKGLVYKWDDPNMKIMAWEQTPEFKKGIERINNWRKNGYLSQDAPVLEVDANTILTGKWASVISSYGTDIAYNSSLKSNNSGLSYKAYPLYPEKISSRVSPIRKIMDTTELRNTMVINSASKNAERVLMFIEWLESNQENYDSLIYGIKGKNYTLAGDRVKAPDSSSKSTPYASLWWRRPFQNMDYERVDVSSSADAVKKYYKTIDEKTKYPPHTGFVPDYTAVRDLANYRDTSFYELDNKVYMGTLKPEDIDTYISNEKTNGVDNLVVEIQKQLDKWKAENK